MWKSVVRKFRKFNSSQVERSLEPVRPVVVGTSMVDFHYFATSLDMNLNGGFYDSKIDWHAGGVGRNIAENLGKIFGDVILVSVVGDDFSGNFLKTTLPADALVGVTTLPAAKTANCAVILDGAGTCRLVAGDLSIFQQMTSKFLQENLNFIKQAPLVIFDANIPEDTMGRLLELCGELGKPVAFDPTDLFIACKPFNLPETLIKNIDFIFPNLQEFLVISKFFGISRETLKNSDDLEIAELIAMCKKIHKFVDNIIVTLGERGVFVSRRNKLRENFFDENQKYVKPPRDQEKRSARFYPAQPMASVVNTSGAGDAFAAGFIAAMLKQKTEAICVAVGMEAANTALMTKGATPETFFDGSHPCWSKGGSYISY